MDFLLRTITAPIATAVAVVSAVPAVIQGQPINQVAANVASAAAPLIPGPIGRTIPRAIMGDNVGEAFIESLVPRLTSKSVLIYDAAELTALGASWKIGAVLGKLLARYDAVFPANNWDEALSAVLAFSGRIDEVHLWSHGRPACPLIQGEALSLDTHAQKLAAIRNKMSTNAIWWFRCCNVFARPIGKRFAQDFSAFMSCRVAGFTFVIGAVQNGLHVLKPGQQADWSDEEGYRDGQRIDNAIVDPFRGVPYCLATEDAPALLQPIGKHLL
eukprot:TRINITY_DN3851_c0_g1_i1.p1 TRINITY_DN3851_c0_g1~~TRINITY_DN3851_c0_g1_i1.p1  ORF type:complete len:272 (+),score=48.37 TRINITY_DN3851_c0_g1_i1:115-930(+)